MGQVTSRSLSTIDGMKLFVELAGDSCRSLPCRREIAQSLEGVPQISSSLR
jgi:hypothetical protein